MASFLTSPSLVRDQYSTPANLNIRASLHDKYSTNPQGYDNWLFENYRFFEGCHILELGCGTGSFWEDRVALLPENSTLVLTDLSDGMVGEVSRKFSGLGNVESMRVDIASIPFGDNTIDFCLANSMLYHVPDLPAALGEVHRVLKPGGIFYAATYGENGITRFLHETLKEFDPAVDWPISTAFTLQNGAKALSAIFSSVSVHCYPDRLEVTDAADLADYIQSSTFISGLDRLDSMLLSSFYERKKDGRGIIHIPKEYGTFISCK